MLGFLFGDFSVAALVDDHQKTTPAWTLHDPETVYAGKSVLNFPDSSRSRTFAQVSSSNQCSLVYTTPLASKGDCGVSEKRNKAENRKNWRKTDEASNRAKLLLLPTPLANRNSIFWDAS